MTVLKWRYCPSCDTWRQVADMTCPSCGGPMTMGRVSREEKQADPRLQQPVRNREQKPL